MEVEVLCPNLFYLHVLTCYSEREKSLHFLQLNKKCDILDIYSLHCLAALCFIQFLWTVPEISLPRLIFMIFWSL